MSYRLTPFHNVGYRAFARDDVGRIAWFQKGGDASYNPMENGQGDLFVYDGEGQLAAVQYEGHMTDAGFAGASRSQEFTYDQMGTRTHTTDVPAGTGGRDWQVRPNGLNQSWVAQNWAWFYYDNNFADPTSATPRGNGCVAAFNGCNFAYNALNQMTAANNYGSTPYTFAYDPLGRLVKRTVNGQGTFFYWDGWSLVQEGPSAASVGKIYVHGARVDELLARYDYALSAWHFLHYDARGHGTHLTDRSGNLIEQYAYDAFGRPWFYNAAGGALTQSAFDNRFLFTGREWLKELQIYDYRHRHYHPEAGRFLQPDPRQFEAGDFNLYRYCHNDPVNKADPTGLITILIPGYGPQKDKGGRWSNEIFLRKARAYFGEGQRFERTEMNKAIDAIKAARAGGDKTVNIAGYSLGGVAAIKLASELNKMGIGVTNLLTIDPVRALGFSGSELPNPIPIPNNVQAAYNFYQQRSLLKGTPIAEGPNVVINKELTPENTPGQEIHHAYMPSLVFGGR